MGRQNSCKTLIGVHEMHTIEGFHCMVMHLVVYTGCPTGPEV